jgi:ketosteroid isomerase-like protein
MSTELEMVRLTDEELVRHVYATIGRVNDPDVSDRPYWLTTEAFERFAPDAEHTVPIVHHYEGDGPEQAEAELAAWERSFERRTRLRATFKSFYDEGLGDA